MVSPKTSLTPPTIQVLLDQDTRESGALASGTHPTECRLADTGMRILTWRKNGRISKKKGAKKEQANCVNDIEVDTNEQQPPKKVLTEKTVSTSQLLYSSPQHLKGWCTEHPLRAEEPPAKHSRSLFKKIVSLPFKALCTRAGAEVHDSAGLDQAVAYYVSATLHGEENLWSVGVSDHARYMLG